MLRVTQGSEASSTGSKSTVISEILDTVALLILTFCFFGMLLALSTVVQFGFQ